MAKEVAASDQNAHPASAKQEELKSLTPKKLILFGIPLFIAQLVIIYFVMVKFIIPANSSGNDASKSADAQEHAKNSEADATGQGAPQSLFVVKDLIVNPAGTNGTRFLLTTIGFEVTSIEGQKELERKEVQVRDILNTILTSKGLDELINVGQREELRSEIAQKIGELLRSGSLTNVYFSKFIIQ